MKKVINTNNADVTLLSNVTKNKGYVMVGKKGDYVLGRDTKGNFIWVRITPGKTTKPVHAFATIESAIADKLDKGYEVFEYSNISLD